MSHHICFRILLDLDVGYFGNFLRILTLFWGSVGAGMVRACGGTVDRIDSRHARTTSRGRWRGEVVSQLSTSTTVVQYCTARFAIGRIWNFEIFDENATDSSKGIFSVLAA